MIRSLRIPIFPLLFVISLCCLSLMTLFISTTEQAQAQGDGTVPGGTVPGGTVPGGTVPTPAVIYLGFKSSDEIEYADDARPDFVYKNEDIVAFDPATGLFSIFFDGSVCGLGDANLDDFDILPNGNLIFTLRAPFTISNLGAVDDSDVIEYTPAPTGCGTFSYRLRGADVGLTTGAEDIDALGIAADGSLLVSTIGTVNVPGPAGELEVRDQALIKFDEATGTWSLYFDGEDVGLVDSTEDIRSVWEDPMLDAEGNQNLYLTLSGDFDVESVNSDEGDKNDVEGCTLLQTGETTECLFFKLLNGESVEASNQLDGLAIAFNPVDATTEPITGRDSDENVDEFLVELENDTADFIAAMVAGDTELTIDDFIVVASRIYLPLIQQ